MRKFLIVLAAVALAVWYLRRTPSSSAPAPASSGGSVTLPGPGCLAAAESANRALSEATQLLLSMPVDTSRWSDAESRAETAISSAESACRGGTSETEREGMEAAREALTLMRSSLAEAAHAALGAGGFQGAARQEAVDNRLSSARRKFGLK
jgi:hypothetical protein